MLKYIEYTNNKGHKARISDGRESQFAFRDIDGVSAPDATINTDSVAGYDGSTVTSASVYKRNIVLSFYIMGDVDKAKKELYKTFQVKREGVFHYVSDAWDVEIPCYTEKCEIPPTQRPLVATVSLLCPEPYFRDVQSIVAEIQNITDNFYFPLVLLEEGTALGIINPYYSANIKNEGDVPLGMTVEFRVNGDVVKPKIINTKTLEYIEIDATLQAGDVVQICTVDRQKRVTLIRSGQEYNYFNYLTDGSTFLQLAEGDNEFQYLAESGGSSLYMRMYYTPLYVGV